jgi:hypothetical protein
MKKRSLSDVLTPKTVPAPPPPEPPAERPPVTAQRINTTLRLDPELLEELKILAARKRVRVNDLLLEGVRHVLAVHRQKPAA